MAEQTTQPTFTKSNDTAILEAVLRGLDEGGIATYAQLSAALGRDVREFGKGSLYSARRIIERDGLHTGVVRNEGIQRLTVSGCVEKASSYVVRARRSASRSRHTLETTDVSQLSQAEKSRVFALSAQASAVETLGSRKATKTLTAAAAKVQSAIPFGETLKLFGVKE